jgi:hypothetical protein
LARKSRAFETALALVQADIIAEQAADKIKPIIVEKQVFIEKQFETTTFPMEFVNMTNEAITGPEQLLDEDGEGKIEKILLTSASPNFGIILIADHGEPLQGNYSDFTDTFAYQEGSVYRLELTDITFRKNIRFTVTTTGTVTFSRIFIKYQIKRKD